MASEFQRRKVAGVFHAMDIEGDGYLVEGDFEALTDRWNAIQGWEPTSPHHERMRTIMMGWWHALRDAAHEDERVTLDEVLAVVDQLHLAPDAVLATGHAMFEAVDADGDGLIEPEEYKEMVRAWKTSDGGVDEMFHLLDGDGDGVLSQDEFAGLWADFWMGDDDTAASQWVFGHYA
jgi:Ca2+-binding EF-hand superfamily protein